MFKKLMYRFGFIHIKDIECEIDKVIYKFDNKAPSEKWKDGRKNIIFHKERFLMDEFNHDLTDLKIILKHELNDKKRNSKR
jgi:hypothetical protein